MVDRLTSGPVPQTLDGFEGIHRGASIIVGGCGVSLPLLAEPERYLTIGVNDVGRHFTPDYLVVLNMPSQFARGRWEHVERSDAKAVFTHLRLPGLHVPLVRFALGKRGGVTVAGGTVPYTRNSPYVAACLALFMGARRIGLLGVDFADHHFFESTGRHSLARELRQIDSEYAALRAECERRGVELVNLSPVSRLTALPRMSIGEFAPSARSERSLNIVSYATTPVAGVPEVLSRCIEARTPHRCTTVWANAGYGNGVRFGGGVEWTRAPAEAEGRLAEADVVVVHNGRVAPRHARILAGKPTLTLAHNYKWNVDDRLVTAGFPGLVVAQYQGTLPEFERWTPVPNPVPGWEADWAPAPRGQRVTVAYTPSGRHERYPPGHRLYWHGKGFATTMRVLERLAARYPLELATTALGQVSHTESLAMKRRAHIVIDECVTGSYHRNSLEGLAYGCVTVNGLGLVPEIERLFLDVAGADKSPFARADLGSLEEVLEQLVVLGPPELEARGQASRAWLDNHWDFEAQWRRFWLPAVHRALERAGRASPHRAGPPAAAVPAPQPSQPPQRPQPPQTPRLPTRADPPRAAPAPVVAVDPVVTVVIPHGGADRIPLLASTLRQLRSCAGVARVVVAEIGEAPGLPDEIRALADEHRFAQGSAFNKSKALNLGSTGTTTPWVLWLDGDLLLPPDFVAAAVQEATTRRLDTLVAWREARYLGEADTRGVLDGNRDPSRCTPVRTFGTSTHGCKGGAVLVRTAFLERYGGMDEHFVGWGGEDDAWFTRASVLGRAGATHGRSIVYHQHHARSAACQDHATSNPHYAANVARLARIRAARTPQALLQVWPAPGQPVEPEAAARKTGVRIAYIGNFQPDHSHETHLSASFEELGHSVIRIQENRASPAGVERACEGADLLLWTRTWGLPWRGVDVGAWLKELGRRLGIPTVSEHPDLYIGLDRGRALAADPFWSTDFVFTADGGSDAAFARMGIPHYPLRAAVYGRECVLAEPVPALAAEVAFVGSGSLDGRSYHREWTYRRELLQFLVSTYGTRFRKHGGHPIHGGLAFARGRRLNQVYASTRVVVGDTLCLGPEDSLEPCFQHAGYWSDRVYETLGRGGFLIHPYIAGLEREFTDGVHLRYYTYGDFAQLRRLIDHYLDDANAQERERIRLAGHRHAAENCTYAHRAAYLLGVMAARHPRLAGRIPAIEDIGQWPGGAAYPLPRKA